MVSLFNTELEKIAIEFEEKYSEFLTVHWRPIKTDNNHSISDTPLNLKMCILLQGPINNYKNFTFETIKLYNKIYPNVDVILSTWIDEDEKIIKDIEKLKVHIILSEKPTQFGRANVNLQIISTKNGIQYACENKYEYILKTRTDYRIHAPDFFVHAIDLLESYPLSSEVIGIQKKRLLSISEGNKYALYVVPDKSMFGHISDMVKYWNPPIDLRFDEPEESLKSMAKYGVAESYFLKHYLNALKIMYQYDLKCYWNIMANHFIVMDWHSADVYWCKYNRYREYKGNHYFGPTSFDTFGFKDWLRVYRNEFQLNNSEDIILRKHGAILTDIFVK